MKLGSRGAAPVLQACRSQIWRTTLSPWMERKDGHFLIMDVTFTQEEEEEKEPSDRLSPVQIHLVDTDVPIRRFQSSGLALDLQISRPVPSSVLTRGLPQQIASYMNHSLGLDLGPVSCRGFQVAFSYSGTCVLLTSIRLYYRRCPTITEQLALFQGTAAGSGLQTGVCVVGAGEVSRPIRECGVEGVWTPMEGRCDCQPGRQVINGSCKGTSCSDGMISFNDGLLY